MAMTRAEKVTIFVRDGKLRAATPDKGSVLRYPVLAQLVPHRPEGEPQEFRGLLLHAARFPQGVHDHRLLEVLYRLLEVHAACRHAHGLWGLGCTGKRALPRVRPDVGRELLDAHILAVRERNRPLDYILKLTDVARVVVVHERAHRLFDRLFHFLAEELVVLADEVRHQVRDVLLALSSRR